MELCQFSMGPIDLPDDSLLQKAAHILDGGLILHITTRSQPELTA